MNNLRYGKINNAILIPARLTIDMNSIYLLQKTKKVKIIKCMLK